MRKLNKIWSVISVLVTWLCLINFAFIPCKSLPTNDIEQGIYVYAHFEFPPTGEILFVKNVHLYFSKVTALPVNTALSAFNSGFVDAKAEIIRAGRNCFISISIYYDLNQIVTEKANEYADIVADEFLKIFDYITIGNIHKAQSIDNKTNVIRLWRQYGYMDYSLTAMSSFMRYKSTYGFGKFIDNFLTKYVPGTDIVGIVDLYYNVKKTDSMFSWEFVIGGSTGKYLSNENTEETIDVNEIIGNSLPIQTSTHQSEIAIEVEKNESTVIGTSFVTYTLDIKDIQPSGYTTIYEPTIERRKYEDLTTPLNNVIVKVDVRKTDNSSNDNPGLLTTAVIIVLIIAIVAIIVYAKTRKSKSDRKRTTEH